MNRVLADIAKSGRTILPSGEEIAATSHIDASCGELLQRVIEATRPKVALEVGLAYGISTLYILEALEKGGGEKLIGMDPAQHDGHWRGGGLHNIRRAGYEGLYEFHETTSQQLLPTLVGQGQRLDFAFIDGWHTFDHTLIDFFYIDQMLEVGGIVVFDDVGFPAIKRACEFVVTNRAYEIYDSISHGRNQGINERGKESLNRLLNPLVRTHKTPSVQARQRESEISDVYFLALRKRADDDRPFDHFTAF